jgi:hypothetical protein
LVQALKDKNSGIGEKNMMMGVRHGSPLKNGWDMDSFQPFVCLSPLRVGGTSARENRLTGAWQGVPGRGRRWGAVLPPLGRRPRDQTPSPNYSRFTLTHRRARWTPGAVRTRHHRPCNPGSALPLLSNPPPPSENRLDPTSSTIDPLSRSIPQFDGHS